LKRKRATLKLSQTTEALALSTRNLIHITNCISDEEAIIVEHIGLALQTADNSGKELKVVVWEKAN
jgi:hypothetical protein